MKRFSLAIPHFYSLLLNQEPEKDGEIIDRLEKALRQFVAVLDQSGPYCMGGRELTLADVHCAPFLHRFSIALPYWRGYDFLQVDHRLARLLMALESVPEFQADTLSAAEYIQAYSHYAHAGITVAGRGVFAGRGRSGPSHSNL